MKLARSLALLGLSTALTGTAANAADYFVKAITPGAVTGTALAVISLQAGGETATDAYVPPATTEVGTTTQTAGKWVSARTSKTSVEGTTSGSSVATSSETPPTGTTGTTETPATGTTTPPPATTGTTGTTTTGTTGASTTAVAPSFSAGVTVPPSAQLWANFDALMSSGRVTGGDRIVLLGGYHGQITVHDQKFATPVAIVPAAGQVAHADAILVRNSSNIHIQGLKVWPRSSSAPGLAVVRSYADASDIAFTDLDVRATAGAGNYTGWTSTDWTTNKRSGIMADGNRVSVARNRITGVYHGIQGLGASALIEANIIDGFSGDGMRALGDGSVVRHNKVQNCHQINGNHTDGFQSWSRGPGGRSGTGTVRNITVEDNKIFEAVGARSALSCKLQGIVLFDGMYENFVIRNNVVSTTAYHGISMYGGLNSQIVNNTVIHAAGSAGRFPWIRVRQHKNGTPSKNVTVANNLVTANKVTSDPATNIVETNNLTVTSASAEFTSVATQDFTLKATAKAIDAGLASLAPKDDINGTARPKGKAPDAGAYESF